MIKTNAYINAIEPVWYSINNIEIVLMEVYMNNKLYRSIHDRKIAGVCGGIGEYFNIDPTIIRLLWAIFTFAGGSGIIAYIICAIVIDEDPGYIDV